MYNILIYGITDKYEYNELIKIFMRPETFKVFTVDEPVEKSNDEDILLEFNMEESADKNHIKREIYRELKQITGVTPPWGIMTGVRPVKITRELFEKLDTREAVIKVLKEFYLLDEEKAELLIEIYEYQSKMLGSVPKDSIGVYIGIPFCPTRCLYCSFTSNQQGPEEIEDYLGALIKEIEYAGSEARKKDYSIESIYIGGGTPTTLSAEQLDRLIISVKTSFDLSKVKEFTVEAGRPDTIREEKLKVLSNHDIDRISINPQTMKDETLELIGRSHSVDEIREAFLTASKEKRFLINADVIAGLPEETPEDFENTLKEVINLNPANITVHTLTVKRASKLVEIDEGYHYRQAEKVEKMLKIAKRILKEKGYKPYYLYRLKHMAGALENVGYCKDDTPCLYNVRIMDENQSILALGAGAMSKKYYPDENRHERVANVSNYRVYIDRLDQMIERKKKDFFEEV